MSGSKDIDAVLEKLLRPRVVVTEFGPVDGMPWVVPADLQFLQDTAGRYILNQDDCLAVLTPGEALRKAVQITPERELIVVAGSLYLITDLLRIPAIGGIPAEDQTLKNQSLQFEAEQDEIPFQVRRTLSG